MDARRRRRRLRRLAVIPVIAVVATLLSGSWWNPLDWGDFVDGIIEGLGDALVWCLNHTFNNSLTIVDANEWQAAFSQAAKWGGVFAIVAVAVCAIEIVAGMIASDHGRVVRGWIWAILAWPLTAASLLIFTRLVNLSDWLTTSILNSIDAPTAVEGSVVVTGAGSAAGTALVAMLLGVGVFSTWWLALIFVVLAFLPVLGLLIVLGAVTFGQIALAGFAPIALMLVGFRGTRAMSQKWVQMAVALLLTKPIAAGIITLGCAVGQEGGADGLIMGIIAVTVAVGSPALAFSFVGFAGAQLGGALTAHADKVKCMTNSLTHAGANQGVAALRGRLSGDVQRAAAMAAEGAAAGRGLDASALDSAGGGESRRRLGGLAAATRAAFARSTSTADGGGGPGSRRGGSTSGSEVSAVGAAGGPAAAGSSGGSGQADQEMGGAGHGAGADGASAYGRGSDTDLGGNSVGASEAEEQSPGSITTKASGSDRMGATPAAPGSSSDGAPGLDQVAPTVGGPASGSGSPQSARGNAGAGVPGEGSTPAPNASATGRSSAATPSSSAPTGASTPTPAPQQNATTSAPTPRTPSSNTPPRDDDQPGTSGPNPFGGRR